MSNSVRTRIILSAGLCAAAVSLTGCRTTPSGFKMDNRFRQDIVQVATFVDKLNPWLNFDNPPRDVPGGLKLAVYFTSSNGPLGVFGDGTVLIDMYRMDGGPANRKELVHLKQWRFSTEEAYQYGFRERQRTGWGYQFRLEWGENDVLGEEVVFIVSFERYDGRVVRGKRNFFKVPVTVRN